MKDLRLEKLANTIINYSLKVEKGEIVYIYAPFHSKPLLLEILREINEVGAIPKMKLFDSDLDRLNLLGMDEQRLAKRKEWELADYKETDCLIYVYSSDNDYAMAEIDHEINLEIGKITSSCFAIILDSDKKWVAIGYPTSIQAQKAKMSNEAYFEYFINATSIDYSKMSEAFKPLKLLMEKTDKVRIVSPGTDISFSIKGIDSLACAGELNIPDGEIFTSPVKESVNGIIHYNTSSIYTGDVYGNIKLTFKNGKIIEATCDTGDDDKLNSIFDLDEGARYIGEFAMGVNPLVTKSIGDILFDEKIAGSLHFTPGRCYPFASNGNESTIHWDLVLIQTPEYGGGEIYFDDILIRKDGLFVLKELLPLNPENLL